LGIAQSPIPNPQSPISISINNYILNYFNCSCYNNYYIINIIINILKKLMPNKQGHSHIKHIDLNDEEIEKIFNALNLDLSTQTLSEHEVFVGLSKLNIPNETIKRIFKKLDIKKDGKISLGELKQYVKIQEHQLKDLFLKIDTNNNGIITRSEMINSLKEYYPNKHFSESAVDNLMNRLDVNNDGVVDFCEWREFLLFLPEVNLGYLMEWGGETSALLFNIQDASPIQMITENAKGEYKTSSLNKWLKNFLAGGVAGAISRTLTAPLERLKILYQVNYKGASNPPNIINGLKEVIEKDGVRGLFRGNFVNCCKATPDTSIKFAVFELFKQMLRGGDESVTLQSYQLFLAGAGSGLISGFCVFPLDVLKTRFSAAPTGTYSSIIDAIRKIQKAEGRIKPFFNGFQATLIAALPNSGINLMTYEFLKKTVNSYFSKKNKEVPMTLFMVMGAVSAVLASSIMYPFQLVTSRIIMQGMSEKRLGMMGIINDVKHNEGFGGFYKGFKPAMSKILLGNGIAYGSYEVCRKYFGLTKK